MTMMTSAIANKMIRSLEEEKAYWLNIEDSSCTYVAATTEEPVIPEYDYSEVAGKIAAIDNKIAVIKHALNVANATSKVMVSGTEMTIDTILIKMAQINRRKMVLDRMRKQLPKSRVGSSYMSRATVIEYRYINYDLELVMEEYDKATEILNQMQLALDKYNQTVEFEVEI